MEAQMKHRILFIDDEDNILFSLKRLFRSSPFDVHYFSSGAEALDFLSENKVSVIVSDMKMPVLSGIEFLEKAKAVDPDAVRIILSGYAEADRIMEAINKGNIWRFIAKPWNNDDLKVTIKNAADLYQQKIERKELVEALQVKTVQLDEMNRLLEKKVEERTWRLNERTRILNMLLDDEDPDMIIGEVCRIVSRLSGGTDVWVRADFNGRFYSSSDDPDAAVPAHLAEAEKEARKNSATFKSEHTSVIVLNKGDLMLGTMMFECGLDAGADVCEQVSGFTSLLDIALFQYQSLSSAPDLIENVDKLLGSI